MTNLFQDLGYKTQDKWKKLTGLVIDDCFNLMNAHEHPNLWRKEEVVRIANKVNEREEIFVNYEEGKRVPRTFDRTERSMMRKFVDASMLNGGNAIWDLNYMAPRFGECGYTIRINESVPHGLMKHLNVVPAGMSKRCFQIVFNLGDKLDSIELAAEELCKIPSIDPYLTILLTMYYLKRGDHAFTIDVVNEMLTTLRLLEKDIAGLRDGERFYDMLGDMMLLPSRT